MSERFTYGYDEFYVYLKDNKHNTVYDIEGSTDSVKLLCNRLNSLVDEIKELENRIRELEHDV